MVGSPIRIPRSRWHWAVALLAALASAAAGATASTAAAKDGEGGLSATAPPPATPPAAVPAAEETSRQVFPVRGRHQYWDGMGAGRGHDGVDIGSRCGTQLVAAQASRVRYVKYHPRGGHYVVLDAKRSPLDLVYMHLAERASVRAGQHVAAGQLIGYVGDTGNASGCHLHFEVWDGAYYRGGSPIDPMPFLTSWDRQRQRAASTR